MRSEAEDSVAPSRRTLFRVASGVRLGSGSTPWAMALILVVVAIAVQNQGDVLQIATAICYAIAASGLGVALGLAGEYLLGQAVIFAISAYVTAALMTNHAWGFLPAALAGIVGAIVVGLALSLIGIRISRFYFGMVGFFLVALLPGIVQLVGSETGGSSGLTVTALPSLVGQQLDTHDLMILASVLLVGTLFLIRNVRQSPLGIHMRRMRDDPFVVSLSGKPVWRIRVAAYVIACALAGVGGAVYSQLNGFLAPYDFDVTFTILLFAAVLVGGATSLLGPSVGIFLLFVVPGILINVQSYSDLIYGATILAAVLLLPQGVEHAVRQAVGWLFRRIRPGGGGAEISPEVDAPTPEWLAEFLVALRPEDRRVSLRVAGARKSFQGVRALDFADDQEVVVAPGEIHLLIGPNGSGKTSLLNAMCGLVRLDDGTVTVGDSDVTKSGPARIAALGVARSYQTPRLPEELTPRELVAGALAEMRSVRYVHWLANDWIARRHRREVFAQADDILAGVGLASAANRPNLWLTSGQRRILDMLMAVTSRASVILLDEPAAGLSEHDRTILAEIVSALARRGIGMLIVEHDIELGLRIADRVTVMASGAVIAQEAPQHVREDAFVREVLMGPAAR
jgi:branched-chain amino acid transport system permease protein